MRPKKVILCVDDNDQALSVRKFVLETRGYRVLTAKNAEEAIELYDRGRVDLVITDLVMPHCNGNDLIMQLKEIASWVPAVLVSGSIKQFDPTTRADAFLPKGACSPQELLERVRVLLVRKRGPKKTVPPQPAHLVPRRTRVAARQPAAAQVAHDPAPLVRLESVDEQLTAQVVGLMLKAAGELIRSADNDGVTAQVDACCHCDGGPLAFGPDAGNGQAPFETQLDTLAVYDPRIDEVSALAVDVVGEDGETGADLVGGQTRPARLGDSVEQIVDQSFERLVEPGDRIALGPQHRVADEPQRPYRHAVASRGALSAASLPSWSRTS